jgi:hypothetical protein
MALAGVAVAVAVVLEKLMGAAMVTLPALLSEMESLLR